MGGQLGTGGKWRGGGGGGGEDEKEKYIRRQQRQEIKLMNKNQTTECSGGYCYSKI